MCSSSGFVLSLLWSVLTLPHLCTAPLVWDDFHLEYVPVKAKLRSFVPLNGAICIHAEMRLNLHDWGWYWALCCGSSAGMWDVNSPAPDCQYPELFNQTPTASPALSLVSVHRPQTQNNFQTRQIKERECHSLTWQGGNIQCRLGIAQ